MLLGAFLGAFDGVAEARVAAPLPPVPACFSEGTGYGSCDGIEIPAGAAVVQMTAENRKTSFYLDRSGKAAAPDDEVRRLR